MQNVKEQVRELLEVLPDDVSFEDLQHHLFVREKIVQGVSDLDAGRVVSENEMEQNFKRWLDE